MNPTAVSDLFGQVPGQESQKVCPKTVREMESVRTGVLSTHVHEGSARSYNAKAPGRLHAQMGFHGIAIPRVRIPWVGILQPWDSAEARLRQVDLLSLLKLESGESETSGIRIWWNLKLMESEFDGIRNHWNRKPGKSELLRWIPARHH